MLNPFKFLKERRYRGLKIVDLSSAFFSLEDSIGFAQIDLPKELVLKCVEDSKTRLGLLQKNSKEYLRELTSIGDYDVESAPMQLALHPQVLQSVKNYLGYFPTLFNITAMHSPAANSTQAINYSGSQLYHRDEDDDLRILKIWILCSNVSMTHGPTAVLPSNISEMIAREFKYRQGTKVPSDELFAPHVSSLFYATGPIGTCFATDTVRNFHFGSRTQEDSERLVLMIHYVSPYNRYFRPVLGSFKPFMKNKVTQYNSSNLSKYQLLALRGYLE